MIQRAMSERLRESASHFPVVTLTGPRQSGKTTLARSVFPDHHYVSLEIPEQRELALSDPRGFLAGLNGPAILDVAQRAPGLFSYIQVDVDEDDRPGRFILTGSQNFLLLASITQSLAGRCAVLHLLPFSLGELVGREDSPPERLGREVPKTEAPSGRDLFSTLFTGFYPRIHDRNLEPGEWLSGYYQTYLERDVRQVLNVGNLEAFGRFVRLCAGRNGQLLDLSSLGADCGISHATARQWLSVLETSFVVRLLRPFHRNFGKRLIKSPKLYFLDSGLLCYLLRVRSAEELRQHSSRGAIFEGFVLCEMLKSFLHRGVEAPLYFWRDSAGHEIDILVDCGNTQIPVEVKSGETIAADFFAGLDYWRKLSGEPEAPAGLIYGGETAAIRHGTVIHPWFAV